MTRIAIVCALEEEADALFPGEGHTQAMRHLSIRRIAKADHDIGIAVAGLGKVNAAVTTALMAGNLDAELLLMSGTCGRISDIAGDVFWIAEAVQHDYGAEIPGGFVHYEAGAFPIGPSSIEPFTALADPGIGLPHARMASGDRFIGCPDRARFLADGLRADLVDMEVAAMAQVADRFGLPWAAIKAPTDDANESSGGDFQTNLVAAALRAAGGIEKLVELL